MEYRLPDLGEGIQEAELVEWRVGPGDIVRRGDELAEVMTDKAVVDLPSPFTGTITELLVESGQMVEINTPLLSYLSDDDPQPEVLTSAPKTEADRTETDNGPPLLTATTTDEDTLQHAHPAGTLPAPAGRDSPHHAASPAVRRLAERLDIDLNDVSAGGPDGRVLIDDLADYIRPQLALSRGNASGAPQTISAAGEPGSRLPFRGVRRRIAERMVHSKRTIPHYTYVDECDVSTIVQARNSLRDVMASKGTRLTYLPFFVRGVVNALKEFPIVNSSLDEEREEIVVHDHFSIGIATSTPQGLLVPVLRNADQMNLEQTAREIIRISTDARTGRLQQQDAGGSTFTVTSIGGIGGLISTPIINPPEVGILGIGRIVKRSVWDNTGAMHPADIVYLSFSFDHRVVDGAVGAEFGNAVIRHLQHSDTWQSNDTTVADAGAAEDG